MKEAAPHVDLNCTLSEHVVRKTCVYTLCQQFAVFCIINFVYFNELHYNMSNIQCCIDGVYNFCKVQFYEHYPDACSEPLLGFWAYNQPSAIKRCEPRCNMCHAALPAMIIVSLLACHKTMISLKADKAFPQKGPAYINSVKKEAWMKLVHVL